eukprot:g1266.t1
MKAQSKKASILRLIASIAYVFAFVTSAICNGPTNIVSFNFVLICCSAYSVTAESPPEHPVIQEGETISKEDTEAQELWKKVTEEYADLTNDQYATLKQDKLKKIEALKAAGGDDKHVEELLQLVEESDRLREEYALESSGAGDLMKEINEMINGDDANIYDEILSQQVDDVLNDNDDLKDLNNLMKDTGANTLLDITPGSRNDDNADDRKPTTDNAPEQNIQELMAEVQKLMSEFEDHSSTQALKDAMMAAYVEEGGEDAHKEL